MQTLKADYTEMAEKRIDGLENLVCPICRAIIFELDMEHYFEEDSERSLDCCGNCREDFEREASVRVDSDVLAPKTFSAFWTYSNENMMIDALKPENANREENRAQWKAITGLDGDDESYQKTRAIWHFPCGCWFEEYERTVVDVWYHRMTIIEYQVTVGNDGWIETDKDEVVRHLNEWHNSEHVE